MTPNKNSRNSSDEIDRNLRRVFEQTLEEDIPDRFKNLLEQLRSEKSMPEKGQDQE